MDISALPLSLLQLRLLFFLFHTNWNQLLHLQCRPVSSSSYSPALLLLLQQRLHYSALPASRLHLEGAEEDKRGGGGDGGAGGGEGGENREEVWIQRGSVSCRRHRGGKSQVIQPATFAPSFQRFLDVYGILDGSSNWLLRSLKTGFWHPPQKSPPFLGFPVFSEIT